MSWPMRAELRDGQQATGISHGHWLYVMETIEWLRCYFTYKVGYVICDPSLGPEAAQREMEAGFAARQLGSCHPNHPYPSI